MRIKERHLIPNVIDFDHDEQAEEGPSTTGPPIPKIKVSWRFNGQLFTFNHEESILRQELTFDNLTFHVRLVFHQLYSDEYPHKSKMDIHIRRDKGQKIWLVENLIPSIWYSEDFRDEAELEIR